jgi:hypothetical protein
MTNKKLATILKKHLAVLGKERDNLRELASEVEALENIADRAFADLEDAVEALSEPV